jgi:pyruvate,water dikinase
MTEYTLFFNNISLFDSNRVGGKNASLGEMYQHLFQQGINVPYGFAITIDAFDEYIKHNKLKDRIFDLRKEYELSNNNLKVLQETGTKIRDLIINGEFPQKISDDIIKSYKQLSIFYNTSDDILDVAVRSSSVSEDSVTASYAGQQDTYLNINGIESLLSHVKKCYASLYTDRALIYRVDKNESEDKLKMSVCIQKMVRSDIGSSGVVFTIDTESGFKNAVIINASYGLGELIVGGNVDPDEYTYFKPTGSIIDKKIGSKKKKLIYNLLNQNDTTIEEDTTYIEQNQFCLEDTMILKLGKWATLIEAHYAKIYNCENKPMDIEWAIDGQSNELYIVQARPETVASQKNYAMIEQFSLVANREKNKLISGVAVGEKISCGKVCKIDSIHNQDQFLSFVKGDILVVDSTSPDWEPVMKLASAIITNRGGRTCHAAIIAREQGIPAIVGTGNATEILVDKTDITVSCAEGETGNVYKNILTYDINHIDINSLPKFNNKNNVPKIMFNLASPDIAFKTSMLPNAGVGLAREEFIINNFIKIHPMALINYDIVEDSLKKEIDTLIIGYKTGIDYYVEKLAFGIAKIAAAFFPNEIILRFSDFKTNEYRNLLGGSLYEPYEENPMIGFRGASRYYSKEFEQAFGLECRAVKRVREEMGLTNVIVMIPFCRTPKELQLVYNTMENYGLKRGESQLQIYLMCEIPSNVILAEDFSKMIDGFSIGSNDLTQLVLGLDRDSHLVSHIYDERNPAVKSMIKQVITIAKKNGVKVGICGQAPSDFPDFVEFLLECEIDSISITPDSLIKVLSTIDNIITK